MVGEQLRAGRSDGDPGVNKKKLCRGNRRLACPRERSSEPGVACLLCMPFHFFLAVIRLLSCGPAGMGDVLEREATPSGCRDISECVDRKE